MSKLHPASFSGIIKNTAIGLSKFDTSKTLQAFGLLQTLARDSPDTVAGFLVSLHSDDTVNALLELLAKPDIRAAVRELLSFPTDDKKKIAARDLSVATLAAPVSGVLSKSFDRAALRAFDSTISADELLGILSYLCTIGALLSVEDPSLKNLLVSEPSLWRAPLAASLPELLTTVWNSTEVGAQSPVGPNDTIHPLIRALLLAPPVRKALVSGLEGSRDGIAIFAPLPSSSVQPSALPEPSLFASAIDKGIEGRIKAVVVQVLLLLDSKSVRYNCPLQIASIIAQAGEVFADNPIASSLFFGKVVTTAESAVVPCSEYFLQGGKPSWNGYLRSVVRAHKEAIVASIARFCIDPYPAGFEAERHLDFATSFNRVFSSYKLSAEDHRQISLLAGFSLEGCIGASLRLSYNQTIEDSDSPLLFSDLFCVPSFEQVRNFTESQSWAGVARPVLSLAPKLAPDVPVPSASKTSSSLFGSSATQSAPVAADAPQSQASSNSNLPTCSFCSRYRKTKSRHSLKDCKFAREFALAQLQSQTAGESSEAQGKKSLAPEAPKSSN